MCVTLLYLSLHTWALPAIAAYLLSIDRAVCLCDNGLRTCVRVNKSADCLLCLGSSSVQKYCVCCPYVLVHLFACVITPYSPTLPRTPHYCAPCNITPY